MYIGEHRPEHD